MAACMRHCCVILQCSTLKMLLSVVFCPAVVLIETCELLKGLLDSPIAVAAMKQVRVHVCANLQLL